MRFERVVAAIFDGTPDRQGEVVSPNFVVQNSVLPVTLEFESERFVGRASNFELNGNKLLLTLELNMDRISVDHLYHLSASVGGVVLDREGIYINRWELTDIALVRTPAYSRIPRIMPTPTRSMYAETSQRTIELTTPLAPPDILYAPTYNGYIWDMVEFIDDDITLKKTPKKEKKKRPRYADWEFA